MSDEQDVDDERVRRAVHVLLDFISISEGLEHTDQLPSGWGDQVTSELIELSVAAVDADTEIVNLSVLLRAVTFIVETLLLTLVARAGDERLALISSIREAIDEANGVD